MDTLTVGVAVDRKTATASLEVSVTALEGTKYAEQLATSSKLPSNFAGFALPGAAFTLNGVGKITPSDAEQAKANVSPLRASALKELEKQGLSGDELDRAKKIVDDLFDVLNGMIDSGRLDTGMSLVLGADAVTFVAGAGIGDTAKLDALVKSLADEVIKEEPEAADMIKLNVADHDGVQYHVVSVPTQDMAADMPNLPNLVGETLDVVIGIGSENAYVAVGRDAMKTLDEAIDSSKSKASEPILPMRMTLAATPIAKFVAVVARKDAVKAIANKVAEMLEETKGKDHLVVTSTPIPLGGKLRIELEEGILKVLGSIPSLAQEQGM